MLPAFKAGAGGPMAGGRQWQPWIHLDDLVGIVFSAIRDGSLAGAVNGVGPNPVPQRDYAATLGRVLHRPAVVPAPAVALSATFGKEMAQELLLASQRVVPARAVGAGYDFLHPDLEAALRFELGRTEG
jgi:NAD dependent epimerase/dehydratase family enzyme